MSKPFQRLSKVLVKMVRTGNNEQRNCSLWITPQKVIDMQKRSKKAKGKSKKQRQN